MERYRFDEAELSAIESSCIPFAVYQFVNNRAVTLAVSEGFCELFGLGLDEAYRLMDSNLFSENHPDDVGKVAEEATRFSVEGGEYDVVYRARAREGYIVVHAHGKHVYREDGSRIAVVWYVEEDAGTVAEAGDAAGATPGERRLYQASSFDRLTGLPSLSFFLDRAGDARREMLDAGRQPAVLFFNLADMRRFNQKHGFARGDALLKAVAHVLAGHFGDYGCCRVGKDQFAAIAAREGLEDELRAIFEEFEQASGGSCPPVRVGICSGRMCDADISTACDRAKYACDLRREVRESQFRHFDEELLAESESRKRIVDNLDRALEEGWVKVYYQPIVRAASGKVCDEEALARWVDPEEGVLPPADFIPALEDARLIHKLDLYVLDQVLAKMKWQADMGLPAVPQSVNLSREDFYSVDVVEEVRARVDAAGVDRGLVTVEITESTVGRESGFMREQVERFRALGFQVWMDDFGSGYSTLNSLKDFDFDLVKLDMGLIRDEGDERTWDVVAGVVEIIRKLGMRSLAEGVETEGQARRLAEAGCDLLQGYYFARPRPLEDGPAS